MTKMIKQINNGGTNKIVGLPLPELRPGVVVIKFPNMNIENINAKFIRRNIFVFITPP